MIAMIGAGELVFVVVGVLGMMFVAALVVFFWGVGIYNGLVTLRNRFKNAFSQIDVQLKRRYDLIPNLVETVKGYMKHERETLENVTMARNQAFGANSRAAANPDDPSAMRGLMSAESNLGGALGRLMVVMEAYPDLKANQNVMALQEELASTENKIAFSRQAYNDAVMQYNTARELFPSNIVAGVCSFREATPFVIENEAEKAAPKVSLT